MKVNWLFVALSDKGGMCSLLCSLHRMQADDDVVASVFQKHSVRQPAELRGVTGEVGVVTAVEPWWAGQ